MHVHAEGVHINGVKSPTVGIKEGDDVQGRHLSVEGVSILEISVPDLLHGLAEELDSTTFSHLVTGVVTKALGWEFQLLVPIPGTPIGSGIRILLPIPEKLV